jgi:hypothetical protein
MNGWITNSSNNQAIAAEIEKWNKRMVEEERNYVLVSPGRWGSSDAWLGIPVSLFINQL